MNVKVTIEAAVSPPEKDLNDLQFAASALTSKPDSIAVAIQEENGQFFLIASFKIKTTAQYKVVDRISEGFACSLAH
ncbi:MAG: hypothetical protein EA368_03040 [Leptolyngbya sp. DLM2.Bin27]|nr:MAG: hypothetical protein EA368_03040 [Leptolyngbya sp. DLM2.Bin27]